jgi:ATP-binding cassette, subfamily B, bacterial
VNRLAREDDAGREAASRVFEPVAVEARYGEPLAAIHPDPSRGWLARLRPLLAARKIPFAAALVAALVGLLAQVAVPRVVGAAINVALAERTAAVVPFVWALLGLGVVVAVFTYLSRTRLFRIAYGLEYDLRVGMFAHLTRLSFSFYDRVQAGQLISRANSDIRSVQMFLTFMPLMAIQLIGFLFAFALMLTVNVPLTIVALLPLPFVYLVGARMRQLMFPISWIVQSRLADVATTVEENVAGTRVVKSFAAEQAQIDLLAERARRVRWAAVRQIDVRARYGPVMENLPRLGMAFVLLYGGILAIDGAIGVGDIVAFSTYVVMLQAPFRMLGFLMLLSQRAAASAERIFEVFDEQPAVVDRPGAVDLIDPRGEVDFRGVSFGYRNGPRVLDGLDLHIPAGQTVAVVGRTGSGKSTLVRLLCRYYDADAGSVVIDGHDVRDITLASLRGQVVPVLDEPFLFSTTVRDNIAYGRPDATDEEVRWAANVADAAGFVEQLPDGYDTEVGERGYTLSGGQRQRIALARAVLLDPRVLILDDATSAIDVHVEERIHAALRHLLGTRTTIVIAHRLSTIALADRVVLLEGGRIVADGTHEDLMATEPRYAEVLAHVLEAENQGDDRSRSAERETVVGDGFDNGGDGRSDGTRGGHGTRTPAAPRLRQGAEGNTGIDPAAPGWLDPGGMV